MADASKPVPEHWKLVIQKRKNRPAISVYKCEETGQQFYKYEDMMRYVNYAKQAKLGIYSPNFGQRCPAPSKKGGPGSSKKGGRSVVGENGGEKSAIVESKLEETPPSASLELIPAEGETAVLDKQSGTEGDLQRDIETDGSSSESKMFRLKYKRKNKGKGKKKH